MKQIFVKLKNAIAFEKLRKIEKKKQKQ